MKQYIIRRLLVAIPMLIATSMVIFLIMRILPGDMAVAMLSLGSDERGSGVSIQKVEALREQLGLNRPIYVQYLDWVWGLARFDLGVSPVSRVPVAEEVLRALPVTLELGVAAFVLSIVIAIPIGVISAIRQDTAGDYAGRLFSIGGLSIPEFWLGSLFILIPLSLWNWMPPLGFMPFDRDPWMNLQQFMFPALAIGINNSAAYVRLLRATMLEVMRQDYVRTARAKGLREYTVVMRHAVRNALIPVVTFMGGRIGRLIGGTVVLEIIFALPGVGRLVVTSIEWRDYPTVQSIIMLFVGVFILANLLVDISYAWLDPRIRFS